MITMSFESARRISEVLTKQSDIVSPENGVTEVKDGSIRFEKVSFKYSEKAEKYALSDIDLTINAGETVGILGATGSSKTTLIQLIPRLYDTTEGNVYVGGVNVKDYDLNALRKEVSIVLQKNVLFSGTIKENLRWGDENATDEDLVRVCELAQADAFVRAFPDGYDTYIEQGGTNVSGGQKQRLCIARALLRKPKVLILDDSTSAVDTKTDALIRRAFAQEIPDTTKIIIAQRVASVEHADKIIVLDGGKILACGNHETLLHTSAIYKEIYDAQTKSSAVKTEGGEA
jgi:ATP-binding cassette subfamily B protein